MTPQALAATISSTTEVESLKPPSVSTQLVWTIIAMIDIALLLRFMLKALAATDTDGLIRWIYVISKPLADPFLAMVNAVTMNSQVMEWGTLLAMLAYTSLGAGLAKFITLIKPFNTIESDQEFFE